MMKRNKIRKIVKRGSLKEGKFVGDIRCFLCGDNHSRKLGRVIDLDGSNRFVCADCNNKFVKPHVAKGGSLSEGEL